MTELIVVEWGDPVGGGGFVPYVDPARGSVPSRAFKKCAERLLDDLVPQPPEGARDNHAHPAWGLQHVEVEGFGSHWCFTVQGRGGVFGRAGSCQFLFASTLMDPAWLWSRGVSMVGDDGRLGHRPIGALEGGAASAGQIANVLTGLIEGRDRVVVDGSPFDVATAIGQLVRVLPIEVVRKHMWVTYRLKPPVLDKRATVTGQWPEELREQDAAVRVRHWLEEPSANRTTRLPARGTDAVAWLTEAAVRGNGLDRYRDLPGMSELVDAVVRDELSITDGDIPLLVRTNSERLRTGGHSVRVIRWARADPDEAIGRMVDGRGAPEWLERLLFDGVLEAHAQAAHGSNPARFPPADEFPHTGWHAKLASELRTRYPVPRDMVMFVRGELIADGKPLHDRDLIVRHQKWLERLGISPNDPSTGIFPVPIGEIALAVRRTGRLAATHRSLLEFAPNAVDEVRILIGRLDYVEPGVAADLLSLTKDDTATSQVLEAVLEHNVPYTAEPALPSADWLGELLGKPLPQRTTWLVIEAGDTHLAGQGFSPLPRVFLHHVLRSWSGLPDVNALQSRLMRDSAAQLALPDDESAYNSEPESASLWTPRSDEDDRRTTRLDHPGRNAFDELSEESSAGIVLGLVAAIGFLSLLFLVVYLIFDRLPQG